MAADTCISFHLTESKTPTPQTTCLLVPTFFRTPHLYKEPKYWTKDQNNPPPFTFQKERKKEKRTPFLSLFFGMVLLVEKISHFLKNPNRLENHHHNSEALLASSLQDFQSDVSKVLNKVLPIPETEPEFQFLSLAWIQKCLDVIPLIHRAFAKLVVEIDHPMNGWGKSQVEEYLDYSLNLLELLNSVTSSVSHLSHAKLCISHGLTLIDKKSDSLALEHLKEIQPYNLGKEFKVEGKITENEECSCTGKDLIIRQSLWILMSISLWVFGVLLSGICSSVEPYMELRKSAGLFDDSLIRGWDSVLAREIAENCGLSTEVKEINEVAISLKSAVANGEVDEVVKELRRKLKDLEELLQTIEKKTNGLFSEVLAERGAKSATRCHIQMYWKVFDGRLVQKGTFYGRNGSKIKGYNKHSRSISPILQGRGGCHPVNRHSALRLLTYYYTRQQWYDT